MNLGILCSTLAIGQTPAAPPLPLIPTVPAPMVRTLPANPLPTPGGMTLPPPLKPAPIRMQAAPATQTPTPMDTKTPEDKKDEAKADDAPAEEPKKEEDKFFLQKLLEGTERGKALSEDGWKIYGWTQGHYNYSTSQTGNSPVPFIQRSNQYSQNQSWMHVEKSIDTSKKEVQLGGAFDGFFGTDYYTTVSRNLFFNQLGHLTNANPYGWDIFQMYADLFLPNLGGSGTTLRMGKFATFLEYEVVQGISNPFISRSYLFEYNPFTHTGALAITPLGDDWTIQNGAVLGADNWFDKTTNQFTYIGNLKWAPKDGKTTVQFGTMLSNTKFNQEQSFNNYNVYNLQISHKFTDKLTYLFDGSYSHERNIPNIGATDWYGMVHYLFYNHTDKLTSNFRFEMFEDTDGFRTGYNGLYTAVTYGMTYKPMPWLYIMPEVRYDHNNGNGVSTVDGTTTGPWDGKRDLFTAAIGFIVRW